MKRTFFSPAKINLCLHVVGKRPDGYHELEMLMQRLTLGDTIEIELSDSPGVVTTCPGVELEPGADNIAARAARSLLARSDCGSGVRIAIDKQIPVAAGLGGGSSNAATVLMGLNDILDLKLTRDELMAEGVKLGADVPFFILESTAWARGIGERLEATPPLPPVYYLLINPGFAVSTAWVYQNLGLTAPGVPTNISRLPQSGAELAGLLRNDLERVTIGRHPEIAGIKECLLAHGAAGSLMSGSGPTVFGLFLDQNARDAAYKELIGTKNWRVIAADPY